MLQKFTVSNDPKIYEAWPDVALTPSGKLICVFSECTHHGDRSYTRIMLTDSEDRGRTWSKKRPLTEGTAKKKYFYNCARITQLRDGRLAILVDKCFANEDKASVDEQENWLYFSKDEGKTWKKKKTPALGIVPDKLLELPNGRWLLSCHHKDTEIEKLVQRLWYSDDQGETWSEPIIVGRDPKLNLCEVSILPVGDTLVAFHRENSFEGWDCFKTISTDNGENWSEPIRFPLLGCHRPVSGWLNNDMILITHRFMQGGKGWTGWWTQNFFAALTDKESALAMERNQAHTRIFPVDFDRSPNSDTGYSGWIQFDNDEIYVVNYIVDDAIDKGQIRGYAFRTEDLLLSDEP